MRTDKPKPVTEADWMDYYKDHSFEELLRRVAELEVLKKAQRDALHNQGSGSY